MPNKRYVVEVGYKSDFVSEPLAQLELEAPSREAAEAAARRMLGGLVRRTWFEEVYFIASEVM